MILIMKQSADHVKNSPNSGASVRIVRHGAALAACGSRRRAGSELKLRNIEYFQYEHWYSVLLFSVLLHVCASVRYV